MLEMIELHADENFNETLSRNVFVNFLHAHLDQFRDPKEQIQACLDYAFSKAEGKGGFALAAFSDKKLVGGLVMVDTGMTGYIPEHYLVYVAVDASVRGKGIGGEIVRYGINKAKGNVALHVEYDNPARRLYERLGFTSKYAEMRYKK